MGKKRTKPLPSVRRLREVLDYDPLTGVLRWKVDRYANRGKLNVSAGTPITCVAVNGYIIFGLDGVGLAVHRVAWAMVTGTWPAFEIDHRDLDKANNRWDNLREASRSQNTINRPRTAANTSGLKGACFAKNRGKWLAYIDCDGRKHLGYHATAEDAHAAYCKAATELHGEFARLE